MRLYQNCADAELALGNKTHDHRVIDAWCPFQQENTVCGSWCPFFKISQDGIGTAVTLKCTGSNVIIPIEK